MIAVGLCAIAAALAPAAMGQNRKLCVLPLPRIHLFFMALRWLSSGCLAEMIVQDTNSGKRVEFHVWELEKAMANMCSPASILCSSIVPVSDEPYQSLTAIVVTCWHTVSGSVQSFVSGVGSPVGLPGICYSFCAQWSSAALRWQCVSPASLSDVGS